MYNVSYYDIMSDDEAVIYVDEQTLARELKQHGDMHGHVMNICREKHISHNYLCNGELLFVYKILSYFNEHSLFVFICLSMFFAHVRG